MDKDKKLKNKNVKTFTDDMVSAIEDNKGGLIKKIIHEEEQHEAEKKNFSPGSEKNKLFMLISVILLFLALSLLVFLGFLNKNDIVSVDIPQTNSIIFNDQTIFKNVDGLNKDKIAETISNEISNLKIKVGGVEAIYLTEAKKVIGFKKFMILMKGSLALDQDYFINDNFLLGAFKSGLSSSSPNIGEPFILLKARSFADVFPVMKSWENKILYDFRGIFGVKISPETNYLFTKDWEDGIIDNKNARILKDNNGKIILAYVFIDNTSVIITNSESAVNEVIIRLNTSQIKK